MGMAGAVLGGSLLGLGLSGLGKQPSFNLASDVHSTMTPNKPEVPEAPTTDAAGGDDGTARDNALMEAERNRERQQAALRKRQAQEVFTSGLGAAGVADTSKKTLLGG